MISSPARLSRVTGFTLVELMVTIAVLAILLGVAVPGFQAFVRRTQVSNMTNEFVAATLIAKADAVARNRCVTLCRSANASVDAPTCTTSGDEWTAGWLIFANPACDGNPAGSGAELLRVYVGDPSGATLTTPTSGSKRLNTITFDSRGMSSLSGAGQINVAPPGQSFTRTICVDVAGRTRIIDATANC
jgi:type IV fimbrial biogenesis protein FimT